MSRILVTGAAGFIGSKVAGKLLDMGHEVITIDNLSTGVIDNIPAGCNFLKGDVFDTKIINRLNNEKLDAIIHIAGQSSGEVSFENPIYDIQTNTESTLLLLKLCKRIRCNKFIYASSMSVYGDQENPLVTEENSVHPKSFYAVGKLASENYMRIFSEYGIRTTALRFFNVYGIGQNLSNLKQGMASIYLAQAIKDHNIKVKGAKDRFRDFVYIDDAVNAVLKALFTEQKNSFEVFNVSTKCKRTVEEVIDTIKRNLPFEVSVEYIEGTPGDQHGIYGDFEKIYKQLGWKPEYNFDAGITKMVRWALNG